MKISERQSLVEALDEVIEDSIAVRDGLKKNKGAGMLRFRTEAISVQIQNIEQTLRMLADCEKQ